jgi:glycine hydroxymethyltransferase
MREPEMEQIAAFMGRVLRDPTNEAELAAVRDEVATLCSKFTPYP